MEGTFKGISDEVLLRYMNQTYQMCGLEHYWPVNYPLVESRHPLYKLMCARKKGENEKCKFSFECSDKQATCLRPFFVPTGFCARLSSDKLNVAAQKAHDMFFKFGIKVKNTLKMMKSLFTTRTN
jgi:hypothetical protein